MSATLLVLLDDAIAKLDTLIVDSAASGGSAPAPTVAVPEDQPPAPTPAAPPAPAPKEAAPPAPAPKAAKPAKAKPAAVAAATPTPADDGTIFDKVSIKVAQITSVEEVPNSEKLYKLQVNLGGETRQVCAGLRQFVPASALQDAVVCVVANLKPARLAGLASEAMVLAAEAPLADGGLTVRALKPPVGAQPGDQVFLEGSAPSTSTAKVLKSDDWKKIAPGLKIGAGHTARWQDRILVTAAGQVTVSEDVPVGADIH